ncbi:hypothetical protein FOZ62_028083, partial [Perkinsus olseni]
MGNALVGLGAPLVFITSQEIVGRCAYFHSRDLTRVKKAGIIPRDCTAVKDFQKRLERTTTKFSCIFFSELQLQGLLLVPMAVVALKTGPDADSPVLGDGYVAFVEQLYISDDSSSPKERHHSRCSSSGDIPDQLPFVRNQTERHVGNCTELYNKRHGEAFSDCLAKVIAYVFGSFSRYLVAPILGIRTTVAAQSLFFIFNALFTFSWGRLLFIGRAYFVATVAQLAFFITVISLHLLRTWLSTNYTPDPDRDGALQWIQIDTPTKAEYFTIAGLIILLAFGDSLYEFELPASIQARFAPTRYHLVAISNYKAYHSLGYFIQFTIDLSLGDDSLNSFYRGGIVHPSLIVIT